MASPLKLRRLSGSSQEKKQWWYMQWVIQSHSESKFGLASAKPITALGALGTLYLSVANCYIQRVPKSWHNRYVSNSILHIVSSWQLQLCVVDSEIGKTSWAEETYWDGNEPKMELALSHIFHNHIISLPVREEETYCGTINAVTMHIALVKSCRNRVNYQLM